jgi:hypothetical protein
MRAADRTDSKMRGSSVARIRELIVERTLPRVPLRSTRSLCRRSHSRGLEHHLRRTTSDVSRTINNGVLLNKHPRLASVT